MVDSAENIAEKNSPVPQRTPAEHTFVQPIPTQHTPIQHGSSQQHIPARHFFPQQATLLPTARVSGEENAPIHATSIPQNRSQLQSSQQQVKFLPQSDQQTFMGKLKSKLIEYRRVLRSTKKPDYQELLTVVKVSGAGILLIGFVGFLTTAAKTFLSG